MRKTLAILASTAALVLSANAQSIFTVGAGSTSDWTASDVVWGDNNRSTVDFAVNPGQDFYLFFKAQFVPGFGGSTDWAIINLFLDLTRQDSDYTALGFQIGPNDASGRGWAVDPSGLGSWSGGGYIQQTIRTGVIYANSVNPANNRFPLVTNSGAAYKVLVTGGAGGFSEEFVVAWVRLTATNLQGTYEFNLNRLAGFDINGNGSRIGAEGVTVRTNFGTNAGGTAASDYGTRNSITILVPEPASMIALGSGLVGLLALRRRRAN